MKKSLIIILVLIFNCHLFGQNNLEPTNDLEDSYEGVLKDYFDNVFPLLFEGLSNKPLVRFTSMPSFSYENVLSVEKELSGNYKMIFHRCSESYWYAEKKRSVKIIKDSININSEFAVIIEKLFNKAVENSVEPENDLLGFDGEFYYFTVVNKNDSLITGTCWSPNKKSRVGKLVEVGDLLVDLTTGKSENFENAKLKMRELINEFE